MGSDDFGSDLDSSSDTEALVCGTMMANGSTGEGRVKAPVSNWRVLRSGAVLWLMLFVSMVSVFGLWLAGGLGWLDHWLSFVPCGVLGGFVGFGWGFTRSTYGEDWTAGAIEGAFFALGLAFVWN